MSSIGQSFRGWIGRSSAALFLCAAAEGASTLYVDDDAIVGGDGTSWASALRFLADALDQASNPHSGIAEIRVAQGLYRPDRSSRHPDGSGDRLASFQLINGVTLLGGFAGIASDDPDARDPSGYQAVLSGDLAGDDDPAGGFAGNEENSYHVVTGAGTDDHATIDGFTIGAGNANGPGFQHFGGGVFNNGGSPQIIDCTIVGNASSVSGGGMANAFGSNPLVSGCVFIGNVAAVGGAMENRISSSPVIIDCEFRDNQATSNGGGLFNLSNGANPTIQSTLFEGNSAINGAAIALLTSNPVIVECQFVGNSAVTAGGSIFAANASNPAISLCTFTSNAAPFGGAVATLNEEDISSTPALEACSFLSNSAVEGGGMHNDNSSPEIVACAFGENTATGMGGGLTNVSGAPFVSECDFVGNQSHDGGGMAILGGLPQIKLCRFIDNQAQNDGGGLRLAEAESFMDDCEFQGNSAFASGGGLAVELGVLAADDCIWHSNAASSGGGASSTSARMKISDGFFTQNLAGQRGGGLSAVFGVVDLVDCTFDSNQVGAEAAPSGSGGGASFEVGRASAIRTRFLGNNAGVGGGARIVACSATFLCSLFGGNWAVEGGALDCSASSPVISNCTILENTASERGGGFACADGGIATIINCILRHNAAPLGPQAAAGVVDAPCVIILSHCNVMEGQIGIAVDPAGELVWSDANIDVEPTFVDPDGFDDEPLTWLDNDYRLRRHSAGVDAGYDNGVPLDDLDLDGDGDINEMTPSDLAGHMRLFDADSDGVAAVDIGATEFSCPADLEPQEAPDSLVTVDDMLSVIAGWGPCPQPCPPACPADLNGDCAVNVDDLLLAIAGWGTCP